MQPSAALASHQSPQTHLPPSHPSATVLSEQMRKDHTAGIRAVCWGRGPSVA